MTAAGAEQNPIWKYLDKILYGALTLFLTLALSKLDSIGNKVDGAVNKLEAVSERVDGTRERVGQTEARVDRLEMAVFLPREARNGK
jgi:hypothetical protein